jgi:uncharacterized membrane protein
VTDPHLPAELTHGAAAIPFAIAGLLLVGGALISLTRGRHIGSSYAEFISLGLEFLLAAGLLRLASAQSFEMLGLVAAVIVARRVISFGIRLAVRATG